MGTLKNGVETSHWQPLLFNLWSQLCLINSELPTLRAGLAGWSPTGFPAVAQGQPDVSLQPAAAAPSSARGSGLGAGRGAAADGQAATAYVFRARPRQVSPQHAGAQSRSNGLRPLTKHVSYHTYMQGLLAQMQMQGGCRRSTAMIPAVLKNRISY